MSISCFRSNGDLAAMVGPHIHSEISKHSRDGCSLEGPQTSLCCNGDKDPGEDCDDDERSSLISFQWSDDQTDFKEGFDLLSCPASSIPTFCHRVAD